MEVEIYTPSPNPIWTSINDGRKDSRIKLIVSGWGWQKGAPKPSPNLMKRMNSDEKPISHLIVVLDGGSNHPQWEFLIQHASDYNISFLIYSTPKQLEYTCYENINAAVFAWDATPSAREQIYKTFATSFGEEQEWEKHYRKLTCSSVPGSGIVVIQYDGVANTAFGVGK
jgi:hypothetical protein